MKPMRFQENPIGILVRYNVDKLTNRVNRKVAAGI